MMLASHDISLKGLMRFVVYLLTPEASLKSRLDSRTCENRATGPEMAGFIKILFWVIGSILLATMMAQLN